MAMATLLLIHTQCALDKSQTNSPNQKDCPLCFEIQKSKLSGSEKQKKSSKDIGHIIPSTFYFNLL